VQWVLIATRQRNQSRYENHDILCTNKQQIKGGREDAHEGLVANLCGKPYCRRKIVPVLEQQPQRGPSALPVACGLESATVASPSIGWVIQGATGRGQNLCTVHTGDHMC
jgi:hypothetical protein